MNKYISISELVKLNGDRHLANAQNYLTQDNIHHAIGSLKKAIKNYEIVLQLEEMFCPKGMEKLLAGMIKIASEQVANNIINGS